MENFNFICLMCNLKANDDPPPKDLDVIDKKQNERAFINNTLCFECYDDIWTCKFCNTERNKNNSFFNNKVCNKCSITFDIQKISAGLFKK